MSGGKPPRNGAYTRRRGYEFERETVNFFKEADMSCRRVPLSGAGEEKGDLCVTTGWGETLRFELKRKKAIPAWVTGPLGTHSGLIMREDNKEALVVVRLTDLRDWLQCR